MNPCYCSKNYVRKYLLRSYRDKYGEGNLSLWSIASRNPDPNRPVSNYFIATASLTKPNRTVHEMKTQPKGKIVMDLLLLEMSTTYHFPLSWTDITGRWRRKDFTENLRFETRRSLEDRLLLTLNRSNGNASQILSKGMNELQAKLLYSSWTLSFQFHFWRKSNEVERRHINFFFHVLFFCFIHLL